MRTLASDPQGSFGADGLAPGTWDVVARSSDGRIALLGAVKLQGGEHRRGLELRLDAGAVLEVVLDGGREFLRLQVFTQVARIGSVGLYPGSEEWMVVPVGSVLVQARHGTVRLLDRDLRIQAGDLIRTHFPGR